MLARHVPWSSWQEWLHGLHLLFSESPENQLEGLQLIATWRLKRAKLPAAVDATADLVEASMATRSHYDGIPPPLAERAVKLLQSMALVRAINGIVDDYQVGGFAQSIAGIAAQVGLPKWLVDVRHEATHKTLPSLEVLALGIRTILSWLFEHYWLVQAEQIVANVPSSWWIRKLVTHGFQLARDGSNSHALPPTKLHAEKVARIKYWYQLLRVSELVFGKHDELVSAHQFDFDALVSTSDCISLLEETCSLDAVQTVLVPILFSACCADLPSPLSNNATPDEKLQLQSWIELLVEVAKTFTIADTCFIQYLCEQVVSPLCSAQGDKRADKTISVPAAIEWCRLLLSKRWCLALGQHSDVPHLQKKQSSLFGNGTEANINSEHQTWLQSTHCSSQRSAHEIKLVTTWIQRIMVRVSLTSFSHPFALIRLELATELLHYAELQNDPSCKKMTMHCTFALESAKDEHCQAPSSPQTPVDHTLNSDNVTESETLKPWTKVKHWMQVPIGKITPYSLSSMYSKAPIKLSSEFSRILDKTIHEREIGLNWENEEQWIHAAAKVGPML